MQTTFILHNNPLLPEPEVEMPFLRTSPQPMTSTPFGQSALASASASFDATTTSLPVSDVAPIIIDHPGHDYTNQRPEHEPIGNAKL